LAIDYGRRPQWLQAHGWFSWYWLLPCALAAALVFVRGRRVWLISAAIFVAAVLPVLGLVAFRFQFFSTVADRYVYLAMLGPALALAAWLTRQEGRAAWAAAIAALLLLSIVSFRQAGHWSDSQSLYEHSVGHYPGGFLAHTKLALIYAEQRRKELAIDHYRRALEVEPELIQANFNLALLFAEEGELDAALRHHRAVIKMAPDDVNARKKLADVLVATGELDEAAELLRGVVAKHSRDAMARFRLAEVQYRLGNAKEAVELFHATLRTRRELLMQIRLAWILATDPDDDLRDGLEAVRLALEACAATNHQNVLALDALAAAYAEVGQFDEAVAVARSAVRAARTGDDEAPVDEIETHLRFYLQGRPFRADRRSGNPIAN
jgi:tetratricopeptide (TPR) repeat protein